MDTYSLQVHYAASGLVRDDAKWRSIAEGVVGFKAATRIQVSGDDYGVFADDTEEAIGGTRRRPGLRGGLAEIARPRPKSRRESPTLPAFRPPQQKRLQFEPFTQTGHQEDLAERVTYVHTDEDSDRQRSKRRLENDSTQTSPQRKRPRTAPAGTVEVPFTGYPTRRISETRARQSYKTRILETPLLGHERRLSFDVVHQDDTNSFYICSRNTRHAHGSPCLCEQDEDEVDLYLRKPSPTPASPSPTRRNADNIDDEWPSVLMGTEVGESPGNFQAQQDQTAQIPSSSPPSPQHSHSDRSTETPSSRAHEPTLPRTLPPFSSSPCYPTITVDLTSPLAENTTDPTRRDLVGESSSSVPNSHSEETASFVTPSTLDEVMRIPRTVDCPVPLDTLRRHITFLPPSLKAIGEKNNLERAFRPAVVTRDLGDKERGHWKLLLRVYDSNNVYIKRSSPPSTSQRSDMRFMLEQKGEIGKSTTPKSKKRAMRHGMFPDVDPESYTSWFDHEFMKFWNSLSKWIRQGSAGWGIRVTVKNRLRAKSFVDLELQVYIHGEMLAHTWLALLGLSGGLTKRMPLTFFVCKEAVVTMTGQKHRSGELGPWIRKSDGHQGVVRNVAEEPKMQIVGTRC